MSINERKFLAYVKLLEFAIEGEIEIEKKKDKEESDLDEEIDQTSMEIGCIFFSFFFIIIMYI